MRKLNVIVNRKYYKLLLKERTIFLCFDIISKYC